MPIRARAAVNLAAIERNVQTLCRGLGDGVQMCAVVKADGYGHGAVAAGRAALAGGASCLAVATAEEAAELRGAAFQTPILVMGALSDEELPTALDAGADVVAWSERFVEQVARRAQVPAGVHVKLDTGMGRLGTRDRSVGLELARRVVAGGNRLRLVGAMTHFATADDDPEFLEAQRRAFEPFVEALRQDHPDILVHAANSAGTLRGPSYHFDLVRCGIAIYGCDPSNRDPDAWGLEPAMELASYVAAVKSAAPGDTVGYGRRFTATTPTRIATIPIGYADGIRRALTNNCDLLIRGRRYPLVGTVSMDNIAADLGEDDDVQVGDQVTIIGRDGEERQTAEDVGNRIGTINYEVVCGISARVPRHYHRDGTLVDDRRPA